MARKIIACEVMKEEFIKIPIQGEADFEYLPMGLHDTPDKLKVEINRLLDNSEGYERIILGYGLCGNALEGLEGRSVPIVVPKVHECIALFMGSTQKYNEVKKENAGTFFLTGGWTEGDKNMLNQYRHTCEKHGEKRARMIFDIMYKHYNRLLFINTSHPRNEKAKEFAREAADLLNVNLEEMTGDMSYLERLINGPWEADEFVLLEEGARLGYQDFNA